jgi:cytidine deaminase
MFNSYQTIHGEVAAIVRLKNKKFLKDCKMVVYRENALGELAMARPCPTCLKILKFFNISSIAYTIDGGYAEESLTD